MKKTFISLYEKTADYYCKNMIEQILLNKIYVKRITWLDGEKTPYTDDKFITITLGVTESTNELNYNSAIKSADDNLYEGKTSGKNRVIAK